MNIVELILCILIYIIKINAINLLVPTHTPTCVNELVPKTILTGKYFIEMISNTYVDFTVDKQLKNRL